MLNCPFQIWAGWPPQVHVFPQKTGADFTTDVLDLAERLQRWDVPLSGLSYVLFTGTLHVGRYEFGSLPAKRRGTASDASRRSGKRTDVHKRFLDWLVAGNCV